MPGPSRIRVTDEPGARVVGFLDRRLFDDRTVREVADQIVAALPAAGSPPALILDFAGVEAISSAMLGKLILIHRRADAAGFRLRLCDLNAPIRDVLRTTSLDRIFTIDRDRREALEAVAEGAP